MKTLSTSRFQKILTCAALALTLAGGAVVGGSRAAYAADAPAFGSVDLQKIQSGYTKRPQLEQSIQDINLRLSNQYKVQAESDMLNMAQQKELQDLLSKPTPTDAEKARITALQAQSSKDAADLRALQQKADATADDKARLSALTTQHTQGGQVLQQLNEAYSEQFKSEADKINGQFTESVKQAIAAVAKDKNLSVVFDAAVAVYTANDVTDEVLKRLNK